MKGQPVDSRFVWTLYLNTWSCGAHASLERRKKKKKWEEGGRSERSRLVVEATKVETEKEQVGAMVGKRGSGGERKRMIYRKRGKRDEKKEKGETASTLSGGMLYCFCIPLLFVEQRQRKLEEREKERWTKREKRYRLLEICIFVGHTSSAR